MASAPPLESAVPAAFPEPPSYEEATNQPYPQYPQCSLPPPPAYTKATQPPHLSQVCGPSITHPPVHNQPAMSVQTVYVQSAAVYGDQPMQTHCPVCLQLVVSRLEHNSSTLAWLTCAGLFIFGCMYGCCLIPFFVDGLKDVTHHCPNCGHVLGVHKRL